MISVETFLPVNAAVILRINTIEQNIAYCMKQWNARPKDQRQFRCHQVWSKVSFIFNGHRRDKTCNRWFTNSKGADQPAHPQQANGQADRQPEKLQKAIADYNYLPLTKLTG